jgi:hypothetical protein
MRAIVVEGLERAFNEVKAVRMLTPLLPAAGWRRR